MKEKLVICILAGGKSRRMGEEKCFMELRGKNLINRALDIANELKGEIFISIGKKDIKIKGAKTLRDIKGEGPIAGLYRALLEREKVLIFPCDTPFLTPQLLSFIWRRGENFDITVCRIKNIIQLQVGVYSNRCLPYIEKRIERNRLSLMGLLEEKALKVEIIEEEEIKIFGDPEKLFFNINTKEELRKAEEIS